MIKVNPETLRDLIALRNAGVPVTLTSHPGNASLYKLVFWSLGIPEHLWDVTCCKADTNNWPMHRLIEGRAELLISDDLRDRITKSTNNETRFVTAYQKTKSGERLGRHHVRAMQDCFPNAISSTSRLLLSEKEKVWELFDYLANTRREEVFGRQITPAGILRPLRGSEIPTSNISDSFISLLEELELLLFSDKEIEAKGGACYDGVMIHLSCVLVHYWKTGLPYRYDISGPDMIHYATRPDYAKQMSDMIEHLRKWRADLVPKHMMIHMLPGTIARIGYVPEHVSEEVMARKLFALQHWNSLGRPAKESIWEQAKSDPHKWPAKIKPNVDHYFSQHDLLMLKGKLVVDEFWMDLPIDKIADTLSRADNFLRI